MRGAGAKGASGKAHALLVSSPCDSLEGIVRCYRSLHRKKRQTALWADFILRC
jgi:hypothetical protein